MERRKPIPLAVYKIVAERLGKNVRYIRWRIEYGDLDIIEATGTELKKYKKAKAEQKAEIDKQKKKHLN